MYLFVLFIFIVFTSFIGEQSADLLNVVMPEFDSACHAFTDAGRNKRPLDQDEILFITHRNGSSWSNNIFHLFTELPFSQNDTRGPYYTCTNSMLPYRRGILSLGNPNLLLWVISISALLYWRVKACSLLWRETLCAFPKTVPYTSLLEEIMKVKVLCSQDMQKHKRPMEMNCVLKSCLNL